jgi:hypothetical protein
MCDYSLHSVKSRPAKVGDKLVTHNFNAGSRGFASPEDCTTAVCVPPGTELVFSKDVVCFQPSGLLWWRRAKMNYRTAIFRQVNTDQRCIHHDALEFPDGQIVLLTSLYEGQRATVLQLPAQPTTATDEEAQKYVAYLGELNWVTGKPSNVLLAASARNDHRCSVATASAFEVFETGHIASDSH